MLKLFQPRYFAVNFFKLSDKDLADPRLVKTLFTHPVKDHQRKSKVSLFQGKRHGTAIQTCFSEKKSIRQVGVNQFRKVFDSELLGVKIRTSVSSKAYRTIRKYGGIDNYLLCMDPKKMDSQFGNYLQTIMLRKLNNPLYVQPYILRSKRPCGLRAKLYKYRQMVKRIRTPKLDRFESDQIPFGVLPDQLNDKDYAKHQELEKIRHVYQDMQPNHPLVIQMKKKIEKEQQTIPMPPEMVEQAKKAREQWLNVKKFRRMLLKEFQEELEEKRQMEEALRDWQFKNPDQIVDQ